jgi:hypothetical protein
VDVFLTIYIYICIESYEMMYLKSQMIYNGLKSILNWLEN